MRFPILVLLHLFLCFLVVQTLSKTTESVVAEKESKPKEKSNRCISYARTLETWNGHSAKIKRLFVDATFSRVDLYVEANNKNALSKQIFDFTTHVWEYMIQQYKQLGLDLCLILMIHHDNHTSGRKEYSLNSSIRVNVLDLTFRRPNAWNAWPNVDKTEEFDLITNHLAYFVEFSSYNGLGSLSYDVWKGNKSEHTAWVDIFTYDVYTMLNYTQHAQRYKNESLERSDETHFPKNKTFWFRDWFLPIYELRGGNTALRKYFELLRDYTAIKSEMNVGSFVHFWSAAAQLDLKYLAEKAFGWNATYQQELENARSTVKLSQFYNVTSETNSSNDFHTHDVKGIPTKAISTTPTQLENDFSSDLPNTSTNDLHTTLDYSNDNKKSLTSTTSGETEDDNNMDPNTQVVIVASASASVICVIILTSILCIVFYKKKIRSLKTEIRSLTRNEVQEFFQGDSNANQNQPQSLYQSVPFVTDFEISRDRLIFSQDNVIGSGEYGCVMHGFVRQLDSGELLPVAIKTVKADVEVAQFKAMLSEAKIMAFLGKHDNIVLLCGTYTANIKNREIYIALELCALGDLQNFLKNNAKEYKHTPPPAMERHNEVTDGDFSVSTLNLYQWSHNISNAMIYLTEKKVIHGDLAARNVLLTSNRVAKINDFGLSRQLLNYAHYLKTTRTPLPWRWMAVESLQDMEFSVASDVWAFGVTLWEIFSLGSTPYPGWTWDYGFVNRLIRGDRLEAPAYADASTCDLMRTCWKLEPSDRPSFQSIHNILGELVIKYSTTFSPNYVDLIPTEVQMDLECDSEILV